MREFFAFCGDEVLLSSHLSRPIDALFCSPGIVILVSGALRRSTIGHSWPRGEAQLSLPLLYRSVHRQSRLVHGGQATGFQSEKAKLPPLYPEIVKAGPESIPLYTGVSITLSSQNPGIRGADVWVFISHFPIFSHTELLLLLSLLFLFSNFGFDPKREEVD